MEAVTVGIVTILDLLVAIFGQTGLENLARPFCLLVTSSLQPNQPGVLQVDVDFDVVVTGLLLMC